LANNVFLTFSAQYKKIENIEHWLRRVLFLTFVNWYKKQKKYSSTHIYENLITQDSNPNFGDNIDLQKITSVIAELKESKQNIIKMRFWEGLKFTEISEKLNKNEAAVKKMLYRTLEEIRNKLE
jgi:RNA polymerase sigma-70 factor (ECF subfamily)